MSIESKKEPTEPKLRHEFVGMMFAVTIAEVGLQTAPLVKAGDFIHFLPAYTHLILATVVIASSWVGWTLSVAPGARRDVERVFQWEFLVLLLDVAGVVTYFILVRTVDLGKEPSATIVDFGKWPEARIAPAATVAFWLFVIFVLYLAWDILTKVMIYWKYRVIEDKAKEKVVETWHRYYGAEWRKTYGSRMVPTVACLILSAIILCEVRAADPPHLITADIALLSLVLLFRASKELVSALWPSSAPGPRVKWPLIGAVVCFVAMAAGTVWTRCSLPLPGRFMNDIQNKQTVLPGMVRSGKRPTSPPVTRADK